MYYSNLSFYHRETKQYIGSIGVTSLEATTPRQLLIMLNKVLKTNYTINQVNYIK